MTRIPMMKDVTVIGRLMSHFHVVHGLGAEGSPLYPLVRNMKCQGPLPGRLRRTGRTRTPTLQRHIAFEIVEAQI